MAELDRDQLWARRDALRSLYWDLDWIARNAQYAPLQEWTPTCGGHRFDFRGYCSDLECGKSQGYAHLERLELAGVIRRRGPYLDIRTELLREPWAPTDARPNPLPTVSGSPGNASDSDIPVVPESGKAGKPDESDSPAFRESGNPGIRESRTPSLTLSSPANPLPGNSPATPPIVPPSGPDPPPLEAVNEDLMAGWHQVLRHLEAHLPKANMDAWFRPAVPVDLRGRRLVLAVDTQFAADRLTARYGHLIRQTLRETTAGKIADFEVRIRGQPPHGSNAQG